MYSTYQPPSAVKGVGEALSYNNSVHKDCYVPIHTILHNDTDIVNFIAI